MAKRDGCSEASHSNTLKDSLQRRTRIIKGKARIMDKTNSGVLALATKYFWTAYSSMTGNYLALATVVIIILLSYLIPDISCKYHTKKELMNMKKVLTVMAVVYHNAAEAVWIMICQSTKSKRDSVLPSEVNRAEAACLTAAEDVIIFQNAMQDDTTETTKDVQHLSVCTSISIPSTKSEPAPIQPGKIGFFRRFFFTKGSISNREIAIMSFVYTNSFDAKKNDSRTNQVA